MGMDVRGVDAAFGQDVDPERIEFQLLVAKVEGEIPGKGRHMLVQRLDHRLEDREPPGEVGQRGIARVAGKSVLLAPGLPGLVVLRDGQAGGA